MHIFTYGGICWKFDAHICLWMKYGGSLMHIYICLWMEFEEA